MAYTSGTPFVMPAVLIRLLWLRLRHVDKKKHPDGYPRNLPAPANSVVWLAVLLGGLSFLWIVLQVLQIGFTVVLGGHGELGYTQPFVGVDRRFAWIYVLPIPMALVSVTMLLLALLSWKDKYWDNNRRIFYSALTGMVIVYTLFLAAAGQLTVFLSVQLRSKQTMKKLLLTTVTVSLLMFGSTACTTSELSPETGDAESAAAVQTDLMTYDGPAEVIPLTAQYPDTMEVMGTGSGEGVGVFFTFKPQGNALDDAEVHVFLPANTSDTGDLMELITGPNGLIESNSWYLDNTRANNVSDFPYPWVEMVFDISTDMEQSGHIVIGQSDSQAIQVTVLYPAEMSDAFWPDARTVLDSLEFDADLLPVTTSEQP